MFKKKRGRKPRCPYCKSSHTVSKGVRKTATLGDRPLRFCRDCNRKFTVGAHTAAHAKISKIPAGR